MDQLFVLKTKKSYNRLKYQKFKMSEKNEFTAEKIVSQVSDIVKEKLVTKYLYG